MRKAFTYRSDLAGPMSNFLMKILRMWSRISMLLKHWDVISDLCAFAVNVLGQVAMQDKLTPRQKRERCLLKCLCGKVSGLHRHTKSPTLIRNLLKSANQNPFRYIFKDLYFQRDRREREEEPNQLALYIWFYHRINFGSVSRITTQRRCVPVEQPLSQASKPFSEKLLSVNTHPILL